MVSYGRGLNPHTATAWRTACQAAGVPTRFLHDCRRTAARNLIRASVPERVAMLLTGHKTRAIFDRYNIINEQELLEAGDQLVAYLAQHAQAQAPHPEQGVQKSFGLAQREMVEQPQGQGGLDGEIRVAPLPAPPATPAGRPGSDRFRGQPHRHIAASNEGLIVGRPVRHAILRLIPGMNLRLHPRSVAPAEDHEKYGPNRPTAESSCNNAAEGARRATAAFGPSVTSRATDPDPEVPAKAQRRRFPAEYRLRILTQADACKKPGELGALLRREGLYSSLLTNWRRQREQGALQDMRGRRRGPKPRPLDPRVKQLEAENRRLQRKLQRAETIITLQKKVAEILGIPLKPLDTDEPD